MHDEVEARFQCLDDDPEYVREVLASMPTGPWYVFETFAADGSPAIGTSSTPAPSGALMVVYEGLTREVAERAAASLHRWRQQRRRS